MSWNTLLAPLRLLNFDRHALRSWIKPSPPEQEPTSNRGFRLSSQSASDPTCSPSNPSGSRDRVAATRQLSELPAGCRALVSTVEGGHGLVSRLVGLGLTPGVELAVVQNMGRGPMIVAVCGGRVALGRGEALQIRVKRL